jgi:hypothetical protein
MSDRALSFADLFRFDGNGLMGSGNADACSSLMDDHDPPLVQPVLILEA